jgi:hypothetical protein
MEMRVPPFKNLSLGAFLTACLIAPQGYAVGSDFNSEKGLREKCVSAFAHGSSDSGLRYDFKRTFKKSDGPATEAEAKKMDLFIGWVKPREEAKLSRVETYFEIFREGVSEDYMLIRDRIDDLYGKYGANFTDLKKFKSYSKSSVIVDMSISKGELVETLRGPNNGYENAFHLTRHVDDKKPRSSFVKAIDPVHTYIAANSVDLIFFYAGEFKSIRSSLELRKAILEEIHTILKVGGEARIGFSAYDEYQLQEFLQLLSPRDWTVERHDEGGGWVRIIKR